jgi:hypothetical protein
VWCVASLRWRWEVAAVVWRICDEFSFPAGWLKTLEIESGSERRSAAPEGISWRLRIFVVVAAGWFVVLDFFRVQGHTPRCHFCIAKKTIQCLQWAYKKSGKLLKLQIPGKNSSLLHHWHHHSVSTSHLFWQIRWSWWVEAHHGQPGTQAPPWRGSSIRSGLHNTCSSEATALSKPASVLSGIKTLQHLKNSTPDQLHTQSKKKNQLHTQSGHVLETYRVS